MTVQPVNNPNLTASLDELLAKVERSNRISQALTHRGGFGAMYEQSQSQTLNVSTRQDYSPVPYMQSYNRMYPVIRIYTPRTATQSREAEEVY